ncbi:hypothetical protein [Deinococcus aerophilus]|uniref:hypothetical protein n=1 Tax=Deinococcus aerophilus TaxID=522488 RepID=UPI0016669BDF|nr:hypothetical protein [Deinococcus aerophilus]
MITQAQLEMPEYSALRASTGMLAVRIECDVSSEPVRLQLEGAGLSATLDQQLQLTVYNTSSGRPPTQVQVPLILTMGQGLALLTGLTVNGSQTLRFPLTAQAGQWVPVGTYGLPLTLSLRPLLP